MTRNQCLSLSLLHFVFAAFVFYAMVMSMGCLSPVYRGEELGLYDIHYRGTDTDGDKLAMSLPLAMYTISQSGPWGEAGDQYLQDLSITVMPTPDWVDNWGRHVAGLCQPEDRWLAIGSDQMALAHELGEVLYYEFGGSCETYHACNWDGRVELEAGVAEYVRLWKKMLTTFPDSGSI